MNSGKNILLRMACLLLMTFWNVVPVNAQDEDGYAPVEVPVHYTAQLNRIYTTAGAWEGKMDIYLPSDTSRNVPLVINIHGGAWAHGVKESQRGFGSFFKNGWGVANIEYRMAPTAPAPAAIEDVRCALIFLIRNSKALHIDTEKIVIMGGSAGGHLAMMAAFLGDDHTFDTNCQKIPSVRVAAVVNKYGVADLTGAKSLMRSKSGRAWLAEKIDDDRFIRSISPINYITQKTPPVFIVHGDADPTVPYQQSVELKKKLDAAGVKNVLLTVENGLHGKFTKEKNREISDAMWEFFSAIGLGKVANSSF